MNRIIFIFILLIAPLSVFSQEVQPGQSFDEQLAAQFFQEKDYEKAAFYYEKLFEKKPIDYYYQNLLFCFLQIPDFKKAEKLVKKQIKRAPSAYTYKIDLGYVYKTSGNDAAAEKEYKNAINTLAPDQGQVFELANAFNTRKEYDYSLETYLKGRKLLKDIYGFNFEIAELYALKGDFAGMVNEYLDVLMMSDAYIQQVQNSLLKVYQESTKEKTAIVKTELLRRIQKHPDKSIYADLLIWLFIQEKDFNAALVQAKALDKRQKENGGRLIALAEMAASNNQFDAAIKAYQYVIEKGKDNPYYTSARIDLLEAMNKKITGLGVYSNAELLQLEQGYIAALTELGHNTKTAPILKNLAYLYAFYLRNTDKAVALLEEALTMPGLTPQFNAQVKLLLGDVLLVSGEVWEATLYYSQVEKALKYDPIADEAKFRNARLSYFIGEFKLSQAHLDILKGSTSKLIANDAMQLSLLITDNSTIDTNTVPLFMYSHADLLFFQNRDEEALATLDSINKYFPGHSLADDILFKKAKIMEKRQDFVEAAKFLQNLVDAYSYDVLADDALFRLAEINEYHLKNPDKAKELYQKILTDYPGSLYTVEARKRFRELRGDAVN